MDGSGDLWGLVFSLAVSPLRQPRFRCRSHRLRFLLLRLVLLGESAALWAAGSCLRSTPRSRKHSRVVVFMSPKSLDDRNSSRRWRSYANLLSGCKVCSVLGGVFWVKMFSYSTSGASLILMPQILLKTGLGLGNIALEVISCGIIGFFTFLTPVILHFITKGYVIRLYHNPDRDTYTAITYSVFLTEKRCVFHQSQVRIPAVSKMFANFYAGPMGLFVNPDLFPIPHDYNHLMGYDKLKTALMLD
uniref:Uncharacterized protein n=1 Tax=Xiphophorus couchianus TaxID=32473 RepID=A0A3B5LHP8_9TELE